ncbi:MAG: GumC family protein [Myxococcota bacterium]
MQDNNQQNPFDMQGTQSSESQVDWQRIIHIVRRYFWILLITSGVGVALGFLINKRQTPIYRTKSQIIISSQLPSYLGSQIKSNISSISGDYWYEKRYLETQYEVLKSRKIAYLAAQRLEPELIFKILDKPEFAHRNPSEKELKKAAMLIKQAISISPLAESRIVQIVTVSPHPEVAKDVSNAIANAYIDVNLEKRLQSTHKASTWLNTQLKKLRGKLDKSEQDIYNFKVSNKIMDVSLEQRKNLLASIISSRTKEVEGLESNARQKRILLHRFRTLRTKNPLKDAAGEFVKNETISELRKLYFEAVTKLKSMKVEYLEQHPDVIQQESVVNATKNQLDLEYKIMEKSINARYQSTRENMTEAQENLQNAREEALVLGKLEIDYNKLVRERNETAKLYELVLARLKETGLAEELKTNNIRMLDAATLPKAPFKPVLLLNLIFGLALGLFSGIALMVLLYYLDNTLKSQDELERYLQAPFLGHVSLLPHHKLNSPEYDLYIYHHPRSPIAESIRSIRTNILFMSPDKTVKSLLFTSASPLDGKTTLSTYVAISMAMGGDKTLLVDADMRKPRIHKVFQLNPTKGLSSLIVQKTSMEESIISTEIENLDLLPCGPIPPNPSELQQSKNFDIVYEQLYEKYDRIIFDSPPVGMVTDPSIIGQKTDGVILVARFGKTTRHMLKNTYHTLGRVKVNIMGGIMNYVDNKRWGSKNYYYHKGKYSKYGYQAYAYGNYISDEEKEKDRKTEKKNKQKKDKQRKKDKSKKNKK